MILIQNCFVILSHEDFDRGRRTIAARDHVPRPRTGALRGRNGGDLRRSRCQGGGIQLRLHPARYHAPRRQRTAAVGAYQGAAQARERNYHIGTQLARRQGSGAGTGR